MKKLPDFSGIRPGDLIGFSGRGCTAFWIKRGTWGVPFCPQWSHSHVAIVGAHPTDRDWIDESTGSNLVLYESLASPMPECLKQGKITTGVQVQPLSRVLWYNGRTYHYPLASPLSITNLAVLHEKLNDKVGTDYSNLGAFRSRDVTCLRKWYFRKPENLTSMCCSSYCAWAHRAVGLLHTKMLLWSPNRIVRTQVHRGVCLAGRRLT